MTGRHCADFNIDDYNHDTGTKLGNFIVILKKDINLLLNEVHNVSSVSSQKLKCPSSA